MITPVYYCPQATVDTLSLPALITRNPYFVLSYQHNTSLTIRAVTQSTSAIIPIIIHDDMEYVSIPVYCLCTNDNYFLPDILICYDLDDDNSDPPVIASLANTTITQDPFHHPIINGQGQVNINNFTELQQTILDSYPQSFFCEHCTAIFHLDSGANVHATNNRNDFIIFHKIKTDIHLAVGSKAQCDGTGAILTQLTPTTSPILLSPVYYCPNAKLSTLSPSALKQYNQFPRITIGIYKSINFIRTHQDASHTFPLHIHNNLDYVTLPILHLSRKAIQLPTLASLFQSGLNDQYIHQKFDHRNLDMIIKMKNKNRMDGMPTIITNFHETYKCPICLLSNATRLPRIKH